MAASFDPYNEPNLYRISKNLITLCMTASGNQKLEVLNVFAAGACEYISLNHPVQCPEIHDFTYPKTSVDYIIQFLHPLKNRPNAYVILIFQNYVSYDQVINNAVLRKQAFFSKLRRRTIRISGF
jgi:hypothetical protein